MSKHKLNKKTKKNNNTLIYGTIAVIAILVFIVSAFAMTQNTTTETKNTDNTTSENTQNEGKWLFAMDTDNVQSKYQASAIPTLAIVDTKGDVIFYNRGLHYKEQLLPYIESAFDGTGEIIAEAPDFTVTTFNDKIFKLSDNEGKVIIIDLMAEYCDPCVSQMSELKDIKEQYGDEIIIISIDVAYPNETESIVRDTFGEYIKED